MPTIIFSEARAREIATKYSADRSSLTNLASLAEARLFQPLALVAEVNELLGGMPTEGNWNNGAVRGELIYLRYFAYQRGGDLRDRAFHRVAREDVTDALEAARLDQEALYPEFEWPHLGFGFGVKLNQYEAALFGAELATAVANRKAIEQKVGDALDDSKAIRERIRWAELVYSKNSGSAHRAVLLFVNCVLVEDAEHATI